ncbi:hypothetical protein ATO12_11015 [Aquimarina atlantica]|uniref:Uncharacterized protein n=1 Tax=Aquimarina atlantica TaxID=1317122 RepID=A0A023BMJ1_9FLAO|nr:hypothetical protein [Aquimarina atlantica]EZH71285.1 hypothetical protein ATO12_11015 [Aquimarina atlantica]
MKLPKTYIKIPITELGELRFMQDTLLDNLSLLSQTEDNFSTNRSIKDNMYWISKILVAIAEIDQRREFDDLELEKK